MLPTDVFDEFCQQIASVSATTIARMIVQQSSIKGDTKGILSNHSVTRSLMIFFHSYRLLWFLVASKLNLFYFFMRFCNVQSSFRSFFVSFLENQAFRTSQKRLKSYIVF
jgi:hypothetical protein